jgi:hypothetical protein
MISSILTLGIRTPEFLDKNIYFPNNYLFEKPNNFTILKNEVINTYIIYAYPGTVLL